MEGITHLPYLTVIEEFSDAAKHLLHAKKRELELMDYYRCDLIDRYRDDENLKLYLIFFDFTSGYTQLNKEIRTMVRIMGIGGRKNKREIGMMIYPLEEVKSIPFLEIHEFTNVKKNRTGFTSICPLHTEKSGSFSVKGRLFHCFGCGKGGSTVDFMMALYGLSFTEAVKRLKGYLK